LMDKTIINDSIKEGETKTIEKSIPTPTPVPTPIPEFTPVGLLSIVGLLLIAIKFNRE